MKNIFKYTLPTAALALALGMTSCTKDLDVTPLDPNMDRVQCRGIVQQVLCDDSYGR